MKQKLSYWLRWILAIPVSVAFGGLVNIILLGIFSLFVNIKTANDSTVNFLNFLLFPIIIGFISIQAGSKMAPKYNLKTALILFAVIFLMQMITILFTPLNKGNNPLIEALMTLVGAILGVIFVANYSHGQITHHNSKD